MKEQWRQQMQQKMADYRQPAPEVSWEELDKALVNNKPKAKTVPMWMRKIAAAVVALVVVTGGYLALNRNHEELSRGDSFDHSVSSVNGITQNRPHHGDNEPLQSSSQEENSPVRSPKTPLLAVVTLKLQSHKKEEQTIESQTTQTVEPQGEPSIPQTHESQPQETNEPKNTHHTRTIVETPKRQTLDYPSEVRPQTAADSRLSVKAYLLPNSIADNNTGMSDDMTEKAYESTVPYYNTDKTTMNNMSDPLSRLYEQHHHQPVRFGLSLRYRLNERWSVESGLAYTILRSDLKWFSGVETKQTIQYVGIPVNANYQLWRSRYFNFYVSAGGMVEKAVEGCWTNTYSTSIQTQHFSIHPLQFSANVGIGAEFNLTNQFSIYAEPGMGYYFDNGSDVPTYYKDTPFNFNLNLGLRFSFK